MSTGYISGALVDAGYVVGVPSQIWARSINRTMLSGTQSITIPPGTFWDWSWEFPSWAAIPNPLIGGNISISPSGVTVPYQVIQPNIYTVWLSGAVSGVTYSLNWEVVKNSGEIISDITYLSCTPTLPPPIQ